VSMVVCAGHKLGDSCITRANMEQCLELMHRGCSSGALVAMESCPLQFACSTALPENSAREDCGPAGTCGSHAHCRGACPPPGPCASVVCACDEGFEGNGYTCVASSAISSEPAQLPQPSVNLFVLIVGITIVSFLCWIWQRARRENAFKDVHLAPAASVTPLAAAPHEACLPFAQMIW